MHSRVRVVFVFVRKEEKGEKNEEQKLKLCSLLSSAICFVFGMQPPVADLEIFRGGFSFTKTPAKLEVKTKKKKVFTSF